MTLLELLGSQAWEGIGGIAAIIALLAPVVTFAYSKLRPTSSHAMQAPGRPQPRPKAGDAVSDDGCFRGCVGLHLNPLVFLWSFIMALFFFAFVTQVFAGSDGQEWLKVNMLAEQHPNADPPATAVVGILVAYLSLVVAITAIVAIF